MKTVQIIGGGLAGLSLGIALRKRDIPVILHEAGTYPRHRVCGEFISGVSEKTLCSLGIQDLLQNAMPARDCTWFSTAKPLFHNQLPKKSWSISRFDLDHALAERFETLGGRLQTGNRVVDLAAEKGVVLTTGRQRQRSSLVGLKMHVRGLKLVADLEMHITSSGYVGLNQISPDQVNICGLFDKADIRGTAQASVAGTIDAIGFDELSQRLRNAEYIPKSFCAVSGFSPGWQLMATPDELRLGDAAAMIAPITGNGMSMAFESAHVATGPLASYSREKMDWEEAVKGIRRKMRQTFAQRMFISRIAHPLLRFSWAFRGFGWLSNAQPAFFQQAYERTHS